mgnify:CR=1 FL=1
MPTTMKEMAELIKTFDSELRRALQTSRSGVFRNEQGDLYVRENVPLGQKYPEEVIGIFADPADLDFFYKVYLEQ